MRQFFRTVLMVLVLLTVAMISALTAMHFAIHGREVAIPKLVGMAPFEAERTAIASGLQVKIERQFYSSQIPEGRIVAQIPDPGTRVRRGWVVRVAQSLGPQRVAIPDVTGESQRVAELNVERRSLDLASVAEMNLPDAGAGQVVAQSPPANASGVAAPKISLLVSDGPAPASYVMPDLTGQPLGSATLALQDAGLRVGHVSVVASLPPPTEAQAVTTTPPASAPSATATPPAGPSTPALPNAASMIVTQSPAAGQKVVAGSAVNFEVR